MISTTNPEPNPEREAIRFRNEAYVLERIAKTTRLLATWWPGTMTCLDEYLSTKELLQDAKRVRCSVTVRE
jgi:hypothetical protein